MLAILVEVVRGHRSARRTRVRVDLRRRLGGCGRAAAGKRAAARLLRRGVTPHEDEAAGPIDSDDVEVAVAVDIDRIEMPDELAKLRRKVDLEVECSRIHASQHRQAGRQRLPGHGVEVAIAVEIRADDRERVAEIGARSHRTLGETARAIVQERDHLLRAADEERRHRGIEVAVAIEVDDLQAGDSGPFGADQRHARLDRADKAPAFVSDHREAPATKFVDEKVEVLVAVDIGRRDHARQRKPAEEGSEPHASRARKRGRTRDHAVVREDVDAESRVLAERDVGVAVAVEVADRQPLRVASDAKLDASKHLGGREQLVADAAVVHDPRHIAAPRRHDVVDAVAVEIRELKPVRETLGVERLQHREGRAWSALEGVELVVGVAAGHRELDETVAVEVARSEHRREEVPGKRGQHHGAEGERRLVRARVACEQSRAKASRCDQHRRRRQAGESRESAHAGLDRR